MPLQFQTNKINLIIINVVIILITEM